jgi:hypothetical protein
LIEVNERVEVGEIDAGKGAAYRESFPFKTLWRCGDLFNGSRTALLRGEGGINAREDGDVRDGNCWHLFTPISG